MHTGSFRWGLSFSCLRWYKLFIDEWRQYISRVFIFAFLIREICENKNLVKNFYLYSTYRIASTPREWSWGSSVSRTTSRPAAFFLSSSRFLLISSHSCAKLPGTRQTDNTIILVSESDHLSNCDKVFGLFCSNFLVTNKVNCGQLMRSCSCIFKTTRLCLVWCLKKTTFGCRFMDVHQTTSALF